MSWSAKPPYIPLDISGREISSPPERTAARTIAVVWQLEVVSNPRYRPDPWGLPTNSVFCNIFIWDATRLLTAEIPHLVDENMRPVLTPGAREILVNEQIDWLRGRRGGWRSLAGQVEAFNLADIGLPVVVAWKAGPGNHGHIAMVMPGRLIAQAGRRNLWMEPLALGFGDLRPLEWFGHE